MQLSSVSLTDAYIGQTLINFRSLNNTTYMRLSGGPEKRVFLVNQNAKCLFTSGKPTLLHPDWLKVRQF